ncbi:MAG: FAD-binding oxidoreductase, partial [Myxococcales bacterium]|nr:FAD-binding oxidoreductase [Myxococcales bacterium]
ATQGAQLARGLGRSYGDSAVPAREEDIVVQTPLADRVLAFDEESGRITAEAGFPLVDLVRSFLPRRWVTPVTPGTKFVTVGGMVASDVHGKNHHVNGCFGTAVESLTIRVADGRIVKCSRTEHPDLFRATLGGMGLTGHILTVTFKLERVPSPWIWQETTRVPDIDAYVEGLKSAAKKWPMTMGWIDCVSRGKHLGRGILMRGRWASAEEAPKRAPKEHKKLRVPFYLPSFAINPWTVRAFNQLYYWKHIPVDRRGIVHPDTFFYPLDAIHDWNRLYGRRGFTQYQCVLPTEAGADVARRFMELLASTGAASPLCVIKDCGPEGLGILSFPKPGISVAVDMPIRGDTQDVVDRLNEFVIEAGGRIYLTKDGFTRPEHFRAMEPRLAEFERVRREWDPTRRFRSAQSVRVLGDPLP